MYTIHFWFICITSLHFVFCENNISPFGIGHEQGLSIVIVTSVNKTSASRLEQLSLFISNYCENTKLTLFDASTLNLAFESENLENEGMKITQHTKYFRFSLKFAFNKEIAHLLLLESFDEIVTSIQQSGYGTNCDVIFISILSRPFQKNNKIISSFSADLTTKQDNIVPFSAVIVFLDDFPVDQKRFGVLCYTCPNHKVEIVKTKRINLSLFKHFSFKLNKNGHRRLVPIRGPFNLISARNNNKCLLELDKITNRIEFHRSMFECTMPWATYLPFMRHLNISLVTSTRLNHVPKSYNSKWWLNLAIGEDWLGYLPMNYASIRGVHLIAKSTPLNVIVCLKAKELTTYRFSIISIIKLKVWACFILAVLACSVIYANIPSGMVLLWMIFGIPLNERSQKRQIMGCFCLCTYLIFLTWQSHISVDSLDIESFPQMDDLITKTLGYG